MRRSGWRAPKKDIAQGKVLVRSAFRAHARAIVEQRQEQPITRTARLAKIVAEANLHGRRVSIRRRMQAGHSYSGE